MESSEEKLHNMLQRARENEAKDKARKFQQEFEKNKNKSNLGTGYAGMGGSSSSSTSGNVVQTIIDEVPKPVVSQNNTISSSSTSSSKALGKTAPKKGMQLFKKKEPGKKIF
jgi:coatomer subunit delta